ncbi:hypothetical protein COL922a_003781 [Colletotrichum nupharicola]|nr:hypothetical protein COL922a_003781 [Colletotrichum nupharicola]
MNFHSILTDLFGASLMSSNPHQEVVDDYDSRRHGGGMGVWLGIWTWCFIASLGFGFWIGAWVIDDLQPAWGFYLSVILIAVVLLLNTLCPEVRRSAFRRSVVEVRTGTDVSRRLARGEVMMHRVKDGPKWWGQEMYHGIALSLEMLRQPGFAVISVYSGWIYAQVVLIIVLLVLLFLVLIRFKEVTIIPESKTEEMDTWTTARKESLKRRESIPEEQIDEKALFAEEEPWRPFIVGNPTSKTRRVNVLELGGMSRFTEIRKRNRLIDASAHLNRAALDAGLDALDDQLSDIPRKPALAAPPQKYE